MNLTTTTTEADLIAPIAMARARVSDLANTLGRGQDNWADSNALLHAVHDVKAAEAVARAQHNIVECLKGIEGQSPEYRAQALLKCFVQLLEVGADDAWSGHGNDARRVAHEAVRKMIADVRWTLVPAVAKKGI